MTRHEHHSIAQMTAFGLAGSVIVGTLPGAAMADEAAPILNDNLECRLEAEPIQSPSVEEIAQAEQAVRDAQAYNEQAQDVLPGLDELLTNAENNQTAAQKVAETAQADLDAQRRIAETSLAEQQRRDTADLQAAATRQETAEQERDAHIQRVADKAQAQNTEQANVDTRTQELTDAEAQRDAQTTPADQSAPNTPPTVEELQTRIDALDKDLTHLDNDIAGQRRAIDELTAQRNQKQYAATQATTADTEAQIALAAAQTELQQAQSALDDAAAATQQAQRALDEAQAQNGPESQAYQDAQAEHDRLVTEEAQARQNVADLTEGINTLTQQLEENQNAINAADPSVAEQEAQKLQEQIDALNQQIAEKQAQQTAAQDERRRLQEELDRRQTQNGDATSPAKDRFTRPELVPPRATNATSSQPDAQPVQPGVYTTFTSLIEALRANTADVRLGSDVYASDLSAGDANAYVTNDFTGTFDGQGFRIIGLSKPLFANTNNANISNLSLAGTKVRSADTLTGALARTATNGSVTNVHVTGEVRGNGDVGGLIANTTGTTLNDVTVKATVRNDYTGNASHVGGLIGKMTGGTITQAGFQGKISTAHAPQNNNRVGGLVGYMINRASADRVYVGGSILNARGGGQVGGLVGSTWSRQGHGTINNALTAMQVEGGKPVYGDGGFNGTVTNSATWEGESGPGTDKAIYGSTKSPEDARVFYTDTVALSRDVRGDNAPATDGQNVNRALAIENYEKLLPFASAEVVKRAADMLADNDPLVTKRLVSAVPTVGGRITADSVRDKNAIDGLILRFDDNTVERRALVIDNREPVPDEPAHYYMADGLPYTPTQRYTVAPVTSLAQELADVQWESITPNPGSTMSPEEQRGRLYIEDTFNAQRTDLEKQLNDLIAQESVVTPGFDRAATEQKIRDNKTAILLGLAYVNRWYNIDFGQVNLRDVFLFRRDFYGANESPLDLLIKLGSNYNMLKPDQNLATYAALNMNETGRTELWQALDDLRREFTTYATFEDWFKSTSKAYMVESPSLQVPDRDVTVVRRLTTMNDLKNVLLPILTVPKDTVFVTSDMANISFGSFERYMDRSKPADEEAARVRARIDVYAKRYRDYYDMWYRVGNETMRQNLIRDIVTWDSLMNPNKVQALPWGDTWRSINTFYGPIGRWFKDNNSYAYANGKMTWMVDSGILEPGRFGPATFIHEQTHNMDGGVMLGGFGRRQGAQMEVYAKSFLENPFDVAYSVVGFNQVDHFPEKDGQYYLHNRYPSRFQNVTDLNQYFRGWFEAIYMLDNAEAEAMLERSDADKAKLFMKLGNHEFQGRRHLNSYDALTEADIAGMNLSTIQDLVEKELMLRRSYGPTATMAQNGYYNVFMLDPLYGTAESNLGITGESAFKRNAYELLGAKGFEDGWVPYVSNKFIDEAKAAGLPNMPDTFVMPKIFAEEGYASLKDYRKDAYRQARERAKTMLKPITITLDGQQITFNSYEDILAKFRDTVAEDLRNGTPHQPHRSKTYALKAALFSEAMRSTDEFKTSIFTDGDAKLQPWVAPVEEAPATPWTPATVASPMWEIGDPHFDTAKLPADPIPPTSTDDEDTQALRDRIAALDAQIAQRQTEIDEATAARDTATASLADKNAEAQRISDERAALEARRSELADQLAQGQQDKAREEQRVQDAARRKAELARQLEQMRATVQQLRDDLVAAQQAQAQTQAARDAARQRVDGAQQTAQQAHDAAVEAQRQLDEANNALTQAQQALRDAETQRASKASEKQRLENLKALVEAANQRQRALDEARQKLNAETAQLQEARDALRAADTALAAAQRDHENARDKAQILANQTVDTLLVDPTPATGYDNVRQPLQELRRLAADRDQARQALAAAGEALTAAQENLAAARQTAKTTEAALSEATAELQRLKALQILAGQVPPMSCVSKDNLVVDVPIYPIENLLVQERAPEKTEHKVEHPAKQSLAQPVKGGVNVLAHTGGDTQALGTAALFAAIAGGAMMRRRRND